jgi:hypothetical protein
MPNRVDAAMNWMKRASVQPAADRPPPNAGSEQLMPGDDPMLHIRQFPKHLVNVALPAVLSTRSVFGPSQGLNIDFIRIGASD